MLLDSPLRLRLKPGSPVKSEELPASKPLGTGRVSRGPLRSQPAFSVGVSSEDNNKMNLGNVDAGVDHGKVTMQTRVAIRDENPHRFQVIPLRDVSRLETSSAGQRENVFHLTDNTTPKHKTLWLPSGKLGANTQSKPISSTPSLQSHLDASTKGKTIQKWDSQATKIDSNGGADSSISNLVDSTSFFCAPVEEAYPLGQLDTNLMKTQSNAVPGSTEMHSTMSAHEIVWSDSVPSHVVSRSLQLKTHSEMNYRKYSSSSTGHVPPPEMPSLVGTSSSNSTRHTRTMSDVHTPNRRRNDSNPEESYYALLDSYGPVDPRLKKRHAIYTPTLYVPNFDQPHELRQYDDILYDGASSNAGCPKIQEFCSSVEDADWKSDNTQPIPEGIAYLPSDLGFNVINNTEVLLEYGETGPMDRLPIQTSTPTQHLTHKSSSRSLRLSHTPSSRPGNSKLAHSRGKTTLSSLPAQEILYPKIILDLLSDTDKAIEEWNSIY